MAAKAIAFINFKGGVGKTAATVNIGASLANYQRKRVLIVDLDAQCNSSFWLLHPHAWQQHIENGKRSTYQIFQDHMMGTKLFDFEKSVVRGVPRAQVPLIANLDLLPASDRLLTIEDRIHQNKYARFFEFLAKDLKPYYKEYDYILFDCPPNTYSVTKNALFAADYCVVPYQPDYLSLSGFQMLAKLVDDFNERISGFKNLKHKASIAALMVSHYRSGLLVQQQAITDLEVLIADLRSQGLVHGRTTLLEPYIRYNVRVAESTNQHVPVCVLDPNSIGAQDYAAIAKNFDAHFSSLP